MFSALADRLPSEHDKHNTDSGKNASIPSRRLELATDKRGNMSGIDGRTRILNFHNEDPARRTIRCPLSRKSDSRTREALYHDQTQSQYRVAQSFGGYSTAEVYQRAFNRDNKLPGSTAS